MKKIFSILSILFVLASCSKDTVIDNQESAVPDMGAMRFSVAMAQSGAIDETIVIKIYKVEDGEQTLVRRYTAIEDVPAELLLLSGEYVAKVWVGDKHIVSFDDKYYYGEQTFTITNGNETPVTVDCKLQSTIVRVEYDATVAAALSEGYFTTVAVADNYDAQAIASGDVHALTYDHTTGAKDGYYVLPEGTTSLFWHFEGTHPSKGAISKEAAIADVQAATSYTVKLKYSADAPGYLVFDITVDEAVEESNDLIFFSPDPTITPSGFDLSDTLLSTNSYTMQVASVAPIESISLIVDGQEYNTLSGSVAGFTATQTTDNMNYEVVIAPEFFDNVAGGEQQITIQVKDQDGGRLNKELTYNVEGVLPMSASDYDLWFGNVTFKAAVLSESSDIKIAYSLDGSTWSEVAVSNQSGNYVAAGSSFRAEKNYTYKLMIDGVQRGKALSCQTAAGNQLPNGGFEEWSNDKTAAGLWSSGNNSFTTLMKQSTDAHSGTYAANLAAMAAVGKFAAGNLFTGSFELNVATLSGKVTFGKDFTYNARPVSASFWMKNNQGAITHGDKTSGTDPYSAMVLVTDGTTYTVDTTDESTFLTKDNLKDKPGIIAYGFLSDTDSNADWTMKTVELTYVDGWESKTPKKISVSFATSAYGDYFCGSTDSWMYVDDVVLNY